MAYLPDFDFDIFLSYAHVDNLTLPDAKGWVAQFHENLEIQLWKRVGRIGSVKIWRDPRIDGNQIFDQTIEEKIQQSALFLALTSEGYLAPESYCPRELRSFYRKAQSEPYGLVVGDRLRIFNVLLNSIPYPKWPEEFGRSSGYKFHDSQQEGEPGNPIDPGDKSFQQQLRVLVDSISRTLSAMKETLPGSLGETGPVTAKDDSFRIYVADTADSLRNTRKRLVNELLQQEGTHVVSNVPPPFEPDAHKRKLMEEVAEANLSVHLLDQFAGREIEGVPGLCYPQAQAELAIAHGQAPFIWVPQQMEPDSIEDEAYKQFLDKLENGSREQGKYDFIRGSPSSITREVLEKIDNLKKAYGVQPDTAPAAALLDTHIKDQSYALKLSEFLLEKHVQPYINPEEDDPRKNLKLFEERLKQVSLLIVFFGNVAEEWVRARLAAAVQIAIAEGCPLKACGVYLAPPRKANSSLQLGAKWIPIELMDNTEGFKPDSITRLLARIN